MKMAFQISIASFTALLLACNGNKHKDTSINTQVIENNIKRDQTPSPEQANDNALQAPNFNDPELKKYYADYTAYLKKVVTFIRNNDEAGTMKLFREEGKQFDKYNEMEEKARSTPEEEQKFTTWLRQSVPLQTEVATSAYYKKFNEEYYKKVGEDFEKKK